MIFHSIYRRDRAAAARAVDPGGGNVLRVKMLAVIDTGAEVTVGNGVLRARAGAQAPLERHPVDLISVNGGATDRRPGDHTGTLRRRSADQGPSGGVRRCAAVRSVRADGNARRAAGHRRATGVQAGQSGLSPPRGAFFPAFAAMTPHR